MTAVVTETGVKGTKQSLIAQAEKDKYLCKCCRTNIRQSKKDKEGKLNMEKNNETLSILRHSTSHIMAQAVQSLFPSAKLAIGPSTADGFYYDFDLTDGHAFTQEDLDKIEEKMKEIVKQNLTFERYEIPDVQAQIDEFKAQGEKLNY